MDGPEHGGEKERPAFSATQEFEVKILWTGPEKGFSMQSAKSMNFALSEIII